MSFNKETKKNYLENPKYGQKSSGALNFKEAIPKYSNRLDIEAIFTAQGVSKNVSKSDTNAQIVIGRDRWPEDPVNSESANLEGGLTPFSGYSSYHNAGAIDLVVGRSAPYPLESGDTRPLYTTLNPSNALLGSAERLADSSTHPGTAMDAARIYMSQMCKVDEYFKLTKAEQIQANNGASSGIVVKADRIRLHGRRDVYIHAGGDFNTPTDSCGYSFSDAPKIHLMVGNGNLRDDSYVDEFGKEQNVTRTTVSTEQESDLQLTLSGESVDTRQPPNRYTTKEEKVRTGLAAQQPVPRGDNLADCLNELFDVIKDGFEVINNVLIDQNKINQFLAHHIHATAVGPTTQDPLSQIQNTITTVSYIKNMISSFQSVYNNIPALKNNYLKRSGYKYINSRHITIT
tara:strand:+ start:2182 stop:3387 length:1206 start_codon:yes stop_codon:yes gene_type:complete